MKILQYVSTAGWQTYVNNIVEDVEVDVPRHFDVLVLSSGAAWLRVNGVPAV